MKSYILTKGGTLLTTHIVLRYPSAVEKIMIVPTKFKLVFTTASDLVKASL